MDKILSYHFSLFLRSAAYFPPKFYITSQEIAYSCSSVLFYNWTVDIIWKKMSYAFCISFLRIIQRFSTGLRSGLWTLRLTSLEFEMVAFVQSIFAIFFESVLCPIETWYFFCQLAYSNNLVFTIYINDSKYVRFLSRFNNPIFLI